MGYTPRALTVFDAAVLRGLFQANVLSLLLRERMISPELVERMKVWRNEGFHAYTGEEIPDIPDALRVGLYMVRGPAAARRLHADPYQDPKVRYLVKGAIPDHGEERVSSGHRDYETTWNGSPASLPTFPTGVEGPKVRRFHARRDGVLPGVRAESGVAADPEGSILAARRRGMRFHRA